MFTNREMTFATTWMKLEGIVLSEISQTKIHTAWCHLYVESGGKKVKSNSETQRIEQ